MYGTDGFSAEEVGDDELLDVAVLNGSPTDNNATLFKNGYDSVINPLFEEDGSGWNEVADQSVPQWDNQEALVIYEQMLTSENGDINATLAANDGLAQAVITARQSQDLDPVPLTGQDATVGGIQNIISGWQSMTVYKAIRQEAEAAAELAIALANGDQEAADELVNNTATYETNGETVEVPSVLLEPIAVTDDNISETVIADGFRTWEEICTGDFEQYCPEGWEDMGADDMDDEDMDESDEDMGESDEDMDESEESEDSDE
jgi:D-xylose transport system substrate-binding protein